MCVADDAAGNFTASVVEMTALDLDKDGDLPEKKEVKEENRPRKGPAMILYGGDGTSTRTLAVEEETALEGAAATAEVR